MTGVSVTARLSEGSITSTAMSATCRAFRVSCINSIDPGQSSTVQASPRYVIRAGVSSVLMLRARASSAESPTVVPSFTEPRRPIASVAKSMLSRRVVLPLR